MRLSQHLYAFLVFFLCLFFSPVILFNCFVFFFFILSCYYFLVAYLFSNETKKERVWIWVSGKNLGGVGGGEAEYIL